MELTNEAGAEGGPLARRKGRYPGGAVRRGAPAHLDDRPGTRVEADRAWARWSLVRSRRRGGAVRAARCEDLRLAVTAYYYECGSVQGVVLVSGKTGGVHLSHVDVLP